MKFTLEFLQANIAMFQAMLDDNVDYFGFYPVGEVYVISECWDDIFRSTVTIDNNGLYWHSHL